MFLSIFALPTRLIPVPPDSPTAPLLDTAYLASSYLPFEVAASFIIAALASYVTLDLARRVRSTEGHSAYTWWIAGALAMGTGIWATHFVGMQAFQLPIELGYTGALTFISWLAVVLAAAVAFGIASRDNYGWRRVAWGALCMGGGICAMHYIGMAAIALTPAIVWDPVLVATSVVIAVLASASALMIFRLLVKVHSSRRPLYQVVASVVMAVAICGMHYTGMAAAQFPMDAVCTSVGQLGGTGLTAMVVIATGMLLISSLFTSIVDARMQDTADRLAQSLQASNAQLQSANAELQQRAFADALTDLPNRLLFEDRLRHALLRQARNNQNHVVTRLAVLFVDLDGFKPINDSFGHAAGDEILKSTAARLLGVARECDTVARIGGDEFLLLIDGLG
ncbi:MAG: MHYT domain-containing protein, partial [Comamonas sp.]